MDAVADPGGGVTACPEPMQSVRDRAGHPPPPCTFQGGMLDVQGGVLVNFVNLIFRGGGR